MLCNGNRARDSSWHISNVSLHPPSFFMPALKHFFSLQYRHWFLLSLSITHCRLNLGGDGKYDMEQPAWHLHRPYPEQPQMQPQIQPQISLSTTLHDPREEPKVCEKWIESTLAWPSSSSSPPLLLPDGSTAASDHPPCRDWDGFGCENMIVTQAGLSSSSISHFQTFFGCWALGFV